MRALAKLTWTEIKLFLREPVTLVFAFAFPLLVLVIMGQIFGNGRADTGDFRGVGAMDYYVPGYIGLAIASIGLIALPVHLATYRELGVLRRFRASGVPPWTVFGAQFVVTFAIATVGALLMAALGFIAYDVNVPASIAGVVAAFTLSALCFAALGFLLGGVMPSPRAAQGIGLILFFVMMFLSGTDGPRAILGETMRRIGDGLPLTHVVTALQDPWIGFGTNVLELLVVTAIAIAAAALALPTFRWE